MKKTKAFLALLCSGCLIIGGCSTNTTSGTEAETATAAAAETTAETVAEGSAEGGLFTYGASEKAFADKVEENRAYGLDITRRLLENRSNETGYRTAGSQAEFEAGEMLVKEFEAIGLQNVHKDAFKTDGWEYKEGNLTFTTADGEEHTAVLGGQAVQFQSKGDTYEVVYAGRGTEDELAGLDVKGKWVLVDIDQSSDWWVNYPAYEAYLNGAAGVLAVNVSGYGEESDETIVTQDICGPEYAPIFSMSVKDGSLLKEALAAGNTSVILNIDSVVTPDTQSYNIIGEIPGKSDEQIILAAHYDAYWDGFQDDGTAIAMILSISRALIDSGYEPEKTIRVVAHGAEEWGIINSRYDWAVGSHRQITENTPEWSKNTAVMINFESPGMKQRGYALVRTIYEYNSVLNELFQYIPDVPEDFTKGLQTEYPLRSWSDDFAYTAEGVPAFRNGYTDPEYDSSIYHTPFDNESTYDEDDFVFQQKLYGLLLMAFDKFTVLPMDFSLRFEQMNEKLGEKDIYVQAGADYEALSEEISRAVENGKALYTKIGQLQHKDGGALNEQLLSMFRFAEENFVKLTWEDGVIFPQQHGYNNLTNLNGAISALKDQNIQEALDNYLYAIDNNWYAYDFSRETYEFFTDQVLKQDEDRLSWGAGKVISHLDLYDVIDSLQEKKENGETDVAKELAALEEAVKTEQQRFTSAVSQLTEALRTMNEMMEQAAAS